jgi:DNA-directed RNA polymerase specialized sigma24 family protein
LTAPDCLLPSACSRLGGLDSHLFKCVNRFKRSLLPFIHLRRTPVVLRANGAYISHFAMTNNVPTPPPETFEHLLTWLNADREQAGRRYEEIRRQLIKIFAGRGCWEAEDLADETLRRVEQNVRKVAPDWTNDPALYFYAVARNVRREYLRPKTLPAPPPPAPDTDEAEREDRCLEHCMQQLFTGDERSLILRYYQGQGRTKIENREDLSRQHGLGTNALRIRMCRLLKRLRPCVLDCLARLLS